MNGQSFTPRLADKMNENMEFPGTKYVIAKNAGTTEIVQIRDLCELRA